MQILNTAVRKRVTLDRLPALSFMIFWHGYRLACVLKSLTPAENRR